MTDPHYPVDYPTDAHPVRPGTSDVLTARTIDATVHPPLRRAQETAATIVPRMAQAAAPLTSPLFLGMVALTLTFILIARRMRYRPSAILVGALLVVTLSSFHPMEPQFQPIPVARGRTPRTLSREVSARIGRPVYSTGYPRDAMPPTIDEPVDVAIEMPPVPPDVAVPATPTYDGVPVDPGQWLPPDIADRFPEVSRDVLRSAERAMRESEAMRALMARIRQQMREQAKRERWHRMTMRRHVSPEELQSIGMVVTPY
jgi:hypothetical protein